MESGTAPGSEFVTGINTSGQLTFATPAGSGNVSTTGSPVTGNCAQFTGSTTITSAAAPCGSGGSGTNLGYENIVTFGAIGDGSCHPLSSSFGSLAAAQAVYPFVSDLTQCVDWAATQKAINTAFSLGGNNSVPVYCPQGNYQLSNPIFFDQANNSQGSFAAWASGATYGNGAQVTYNGIPWQSQGSGNIGNPPTSAHGFPASLAISGPTSFPWAVVQISNANPAVFTISAGHNLTANQPITLFTQQFANPNGGSAPTLPTGLNANQVYYVVGASITGTTFQVSATPGGAAVATSSVGVGVFFANTQVWAVQPAAAANFANHVAWIGGDGPSSNTGCRIQSNAWNTAAVFVGPQQGNYIKSIHLIGFPSSGNNAYRCGKLPNMYGFVQVTNGGGSSRSKVEDSQAEGFYINYSVGAYGAGTLGDSNTFIKDVFDDGCVGLQFSETQAFINTVLDGTLSDNTTAIDAHVNSGAKVVGGNYSSPQWIHNSFSITSPTFVQSGNTFYVTATVTSPDQYLLNPMCAYAAGTANNQQSPTLGYTPQGYSCGYGVFTIKTSQWGVIPMFVVNFVPTSGAITLQIAPAWKAVYQNTCCGSNLATQIGAATTLYASELVTSYYGNLLVDENHIENDGAPTVLICACENFGGNRPAELKNVLINSEASQGFFVCCNQSPTSAQLSDFYGQSVTPYINAQAFDIVIDSLSGGTNNTSRNSMDRMLIATGGGVYVEGRHTSVQQGPAGGNVPKFDFVPGATPTVGILNLSQTAGDLSNGYFQTGGGAFGAGNWDNAGMFTSWADRSSDVLNFGGPTNMADVWRVSGVGQAPTWGVKPAPWANPCITPSQVTTLGSLPTITHQSQLHDFLVVTAGGTGYAVNDTVTLAGGTFSTAAVVKVTAVSGGVITAVSVQNAGVYSVEPTLIAGFTQGSTSGSGVGATFNVGSNGQAWFVNYTIGYPILFGGTLYKECDYKGASALHAHQWNGTGYSYFQNLTTTNVPNLAWTMDGASPFINMNQEALELMFPGLVISLTGTGGCSGTQSFVVLEVHPTLGYAKVVRADSDTGPFVPSLAASGTTCTGTTIGQAAVGTLVQPY